MAVEIRECSNKFCIEKDTFLVDHEKPFHQRNICKRKLHLNKSGTSTLSRNFFKTFSNIWR